MSESIYEVERAFLDLREATKNSHWQTEVLRLAEQSIRERFDELEQAAARLRDALAAQRIDHANDLRQSAETQGELDTIRAQLSEAQARLAEIENGHRWLPDLPFFREQISRAKVQTPYGDGLPAPWAFLSMACDCVDALANRLAEIERQEPVGEVTALMFDDSACDLAEMYCNGQLPIGTKLYAAPVPPASQVAQGVADGLALLPAEATDEMQDNMRQAMIDQGWDSDRAGEVDFSDIWHAGVYEYQEREADLLAAQQQKEGKP